MPISFYEKNRTFHLQAGNRNYIFQVYGMDI